MKASVGFSSRASLLHLAIGALIAGCGSSAVPPAAPATTPSAVASAAPEASAASAAPDPAAATTAAPAAGSPGPAEGMNTFAVKLDESKAVKELGPDGAKLLSLAKMSPKTYKSLLRAYLYSPIAECPAQDVVEVAPVPGLFVASKGIKVRKQVYEGLQSAAALAKQRGVGIEIVAGQRTIKEAVASWNHEILEEALDLVKKASPADRKDKSFAGQARKEMDDGEGPKTWVTSPCDKGKLGGWSVDVQLVGLTPAGTRGPVLVKAGEDAPHFTKDAFESIYWDKHKGKSFRKLTEIMSAGRFVRRCDLPYHFFTTPMADGTWRCKLDGESWDPENRPIPAWE